MASLLPTNEHPVERVLRVLVGLGVISLAFVGPKTAWGYLGFVPLATGLLGSCPLLEFGTWDGLQWHPWFPLVCVHRASFRQPSTASRSGWQFYSGRDARLRPYMFFLFTGSRIQ